VTRSGQASLVYVAFATVALILLVPRFRRAVFTQIAWVWALQTSAVTASVNGLRGNWDVWK
jgi:xanthine/uracil permease